jgi:hypothetical protein
VRYLAELAAGQSPGKLKPRLERRMPDVDARFANHFRKWQRK